VVSNAKDLWVLGAGPFQRGTIYSGDDDVMKVPLAFGRPRFRKKNDAPVRVVRNENFRSGGQLAKKDQEKADEPVLTAQAPPTAAPTQGAAPAASPSATPAPAQTQPLPPVEGLAPGGGAAPSLDQLQIPGPPLPPGRAGDVLRR
jgi:hypothetical protein